MQLTEATAPCTIRFFREGAPEEVLAGPFAAVLHLFEHRYSPELVFWYGAADVSWEMQAFFDLWATLRWHEYAVSLTLEDGRSGTGRVLNGSGEWQRSDLHNLVVALFGVSALVKPGETPPSPPSFPPRPAQAE